MPTKINIKIRKLSYNKVLIKGEFFVFFDIFSHLGLICFKNTSGYKFGENLPKSDISNCGFEFAAFNTFLVHVNINLLNIFTG